MSCGIYGFLHIPTGKWYIGQSIDIERREKEHRNSIENDWHQLLLKEPHNFHFTILEECSPESLDAREAYYIKTYNSYENGFNSTRGNYVEEKEENKLNTSILITEWCGYTITEKDIARLLRAIQTQSFKSTIEKILHHCNRLYNYVKYDLTWKFDEDHFLIHAWPFLNEYCKKSDKLPIYLNLEHNITKQRDIELENIIKKDKIDWEDNHNSTGDFYRWYYIARKGSGYMCDKTFQINKEHFLCSSISLKTISYKDLSKLHEEVQLQRIDCDPYFII